MRASRSGFLAAASLAALIALGAGCAGSGKAPPVPGPEAAAESAAHSAADASFDSLRSARIREALERFERAVLDKDSAALVRLLVADYREKELQGFYRADTGHFLDEFFCGRTPDGRQLRCLPFRGITGLSGLRVEAAGGGWGGWTRSTVTWQVHSGADAIEARLTLDAEKDGRLRGFLGSNGYTQVE